MTHARMLPSASRLPLVAASLAILLAAPGCSGDDAGGGGTTTASDTALASDVAADTASNADVAADTTSASDVAADTTPASDVAADTTPASDVAADTASNADVEADSAPAGDSVGDGGSDATQPPDAASETGDASASPCNNVVNLGTLVPVTRIAAAAAPQTGGTLVDGTYKVMNASIFTGVGGAAGPTGEQLQQTLVIKVSSDASAATAEAVSSDGTTTSHRNLALQTSGTQLVMSTTCPAGLPAETFAYRAAGTLLSLSSVVADGTKVVTYLREK